MNFKEYITHFEDVITTDSPKEPYNDPDFLDYAKLNWSRMNRWLKNGVIEDETTQKIKNVAGKQKWVLITEPWCGDAAHLVPFIEKMAELNPNIELEIQLRDNGSEIDNYLTNGGKSIPKLIIRDTEGKDLKVWGPRPVSCQDYFNQGKAEGLEHDDLKIALQKWYNEDKGKTVQKEIAALIG